jgi:hypothetical protein
MHIIPDKKGSGGPDIQAFTRGSLRYSSTASLSDILRGVRTMSSWSCRGRNGSLVASRRGRENLEGIIGNSEGCMIAMSKHILVVEVVYM